jgi:hypothetical protein
MLKEMDKIIRALLFLSAIDVCYWKMDGIRNGVCFPGSYGSTIATTRKKTNNPATPLQ